MTPESAEEKAWLDQTLHAFDGAARAAPNPFLYTRIREQLVNQRVARVSARQAWAAVAGLALLAALNWRVVTSTAPVPTARGLAEQVVTDYDLGPNEDWNLGG